MFGFRNGWPPAAVASTPKGSRRSTARIHSSSLTARSFRRTAVSDGGKASSGVIAALRGAICANLWADGIVLWSGRQSHSRRIRPDHFSGAPMPTDLPTVYARLLSGDPAVPLFRQVYDGLRTAILGGQLPPGTRLPATRALASDLG